MLRAAALEPSLLRPGSNCSWLATSNSGFLTITSGFGGGWQWRHRLFSVRQLRHRFAHWDAKHSWQGVYGDSGGQSRFRRKQTGHQGGEWRGQWRQFPSGNRARFLCECIFGTNLASTTTGKDWSGSITNGQLPTQIDGVSVSIAGKPAYIEYIRQDQINLQVPDAGVGPVQVTVTTSDGTSDPVTVTSQQFGPAFFLFGTKYAVTQHYPDYGYSSNPSVVPGAVAAKPGDILILWGTGFGPTNPAVPVGQVPPPTGPIVTGGGFQSPSRWAASPPS